MSKIERDNTMLDLAIKVILEFGDERYDIERVNLNISCQVVSNGENKGRVYYEVLYECGTTKYSWEWNYLVKIYFWKDTGSIDYVVFGDGSNLLKKDMEAIRNEQKQKNCSTNMCYGDDFLYVCKLYSSKRRGNNKRYCA